MPIVEQFEVLQLLHHDVAETWAVVERSSGKRFLLHKFPKETGLRDRLLSMPSDDLIMLVSADEEDSSYVVVTHDFPALRQFRDWVERRSRPAEETPSSVGGQSTAANEPGEFTRMFQAPPVQDEANPLVPRSLVLPNEPPKRSNPGTPVLRNELPKQSGPTPGEFTRMFQVPSVRNEPNPEVGSSSVLRNEPDPQVAGTPVLRNELPKQLNPAPGEFTRMFQVPSVRNEPNAEVASTPVLRNEPNPQVAGTPVLRNEVPQQPNPAPGEFTRMFQVPSVRNEPNAEVASSAVLRNEPNPQVAGTPVLRNELPKQSDPAPGEFTRMFQAPPVRNEPNAEVASSAVLRNELKVTGGGIQKLPVAEPGEFTQMFSNPFPTAPSGERFETLAPPPPPRPAGQPSQGSASLLDGGSATGIFAGPKFAASGSMRPSAPAGPSEYTRVIRSPVSQQPLSQVVKPAEQSPLPAKPGQTRNVLPLVIILAVLVIGAVALLLYFVVKR